MAISGLIKDCGTNKLRDLEKIKEMIYLFYCYQWVFTEKAKDSSISTGKLNYEVVVERKRGLEWLISAENDWF